MQKIFVFALGIFGALGALTTHAQTTPAQSQIVITWQALNSYAPAGYSAKILPNQESQIAASLELIGANGKLVDLSGQTIYWYQNDTLLGGGVGDQHFTFHPFGQAPTTISLSVQVPDYPSGALSQEISIPVVQPVAIIEAPYPQGTFATDAIHVQAEPYFFAVASTSPLSFAWSVNGQSVASAENPQSLQISLPQSTPAGYAVGINLTIQNSIDSVVATGNTTLTHSPSL